MSWRRWNWPLTLCGCAAWTYPASGAFGRDSESSTELDLVPDNRHVVLNFADRRRGLTLQDVEATIGCPVDVVLPRSRAVPYSTNKGVPLLQEGTRDSVAKGLRQLVERFSANWEQRPHKKLHRRAVVQ